MTNSTNREAVLPNGLKVIGEINASHKSCALGFFVKTGARDESEKESGLSHFLEHMMFKGTARRTALDVNLQLGNIGAQANAFTSEENTVFYSSILPEYFPDLLELLSDMMRPALNQEDFDMEKKVILEEIALYRDRPSFYLYENASREFFNKHALANSVLGSIESITAVTAGQMREYFDRRYSPANMVLVATGNFDWDNFLLRAEEYTSTWQKKDAARDTARFTRQGAGKVFKRKNLNQAHMLFFSPSCGAGEQERYPLAILSVILGDGSGSKFFWELVDKGLAESASAEQDDKDGSGVFSAYASTKPENVDKVSAIIKHIFNNALDFSQQDIERAKAKVISRLILRGELPMGRLMALGMEWIYRQRLHNLKSEVEKIESISADDIEKALTKFPFKFSEYILLPEN